MGGLKIYITAVVLISVVAGVLPGGRRFGKTWYQCDADRWPREGDPEIHGPAKARLSGPSFLIPSSSYTLSDEASWYNLHDGQKIVTFSQMLNITCYDSGFYTIPSIPFNYRLLPDTSRQWSPHHAIAAVHTVKVDTTAIKPIIDLEDPITFRELLPGYWLPSVIILVIAAIWYFTKRKRKEPIFQLKQRLCCSHTSGLMEFEKLRVKNYAERKS